MDQQRFATIILRSLRGILLLTVVAGAAAFAVSMVLPKQWESEARLLVGSLTETDTQQLDAYQQLASTYAEVATSAPVMLRVIDRLDLPDDVESLGKRVSIRSAVGQAVIKITATAGDPQAAADLANAFAAEIVKLGLPTPRDTTSLVSRYQPGEPPPDPSSPKILINTLIAAAVGFVVGVGLAVLLAMVRDARAAAADRRRQSSAGALVPTVTAGVASQPGRSGPAWPAGVGPGGYPAISVSTVAPMPRPVDRGYEAPQIAGSTTTPAPRPQAPSAWGPQPVRTEPYIAPPRAPMTPAVTPTVQPSGPTFLEIIEARTAPPSRSTAPSGMVPPSSNGATSDEATREEMSEPAATPVLSPASMGAIPPADGSAPTPVAPTPMATTPPVVSAPVPPTKPPTIPLAPNVSTVTLASLASSPTPASTPPAADIVAAAVALPVAADTPTESRPRPVRRTRAKPVEATPVDTAPHVDAPPSTTRAPSTTTAPTARRSTASRTSTTRTRTPASADSSPSAPIGPDGVDQMSPAPTSTTRKRSSRSVAATPSDGAEDAEAPEVKPKAKKSARVETEVPIEAPLPPPATTRTRKSVAPAPQT